MRTFLIHKQKPFQKMKSEPLQEIPPVYLSQNSEGWSLIKDGMPLCAVTTRENAENVASRFKLSLPSVYWQGERGQFVSI
jgi:hypothetical protein